MKSYLVYFVQMEDSPSLEIVGFFSDKSMAIRTYRKGKREDDKFNGKPSTDYEPSDWRKTHILTVNTDAKVGQAVYVTTIIDWLEYIDARIDSVTTSEKESEERLREIYLKEKETFGRLSDDDFYPKYFHIADDSVMEDIYGIVHNVKLK